MGRSARSSCSSKVLRVRRRRVRGEQRVRIESVLTGKQAGKEVEDTIKVEVSSEFHAMRAMRVADVVNKLPTLDGGFARAKVIPA